MTKQELLNYLETIDGELTDAYNTGYDDPINSDSLYYIDSAKDLMGELIHRIENDVEISEKEEHDFNEAMNGEFKA